MGATPVGPREEAMKLFSRTVTLRGNPRDTVPYIRDIHALVNEKSSFEISLWQGLLGMPVGSYAFSTVVETRTELLAGMAELENDAEYYDLLDRGQDFFVAPAEDALVEVLHTSGGEFRRAGVGSVVSIVQATMETHHTGEAIEWATGIADLVATITTIPVNVGATQHSAFGQLEWISTYADMGEVDRAAEALGKDEDYIARLASTDGLFVPASGRQMLGIRIA